MRTQLRVLMSRSLISKVDVLWKYYTMFSVPLESFVYSHFLNEWLKQCTPNLFWTKVLRRHPVALKQITAQNSSPIPGWNPYWYLTECTATLALALTNKVTCHCYFKMIYIIISTFLFLFFLFFPPNYLMFKVS